MYLGRGRLGLGRGALDQFLHFSGGSQISSQKIGRMTALYVGKMHDKMHLIDDLFRPTLG